MKVQSVVRWYWMDQELTFLKKSIDRRAHDHSSFFLLVTNRVVLTEKKAQKVFQQRLLSVRMLKIRSTHVLYPNPWLKIYCFILSKFWVLIEYFWRSIVIFMHLQKKSVSLLSNNSPKFNWGQTGFFNMWTICNPATF